MDIPAKMPVDSRVEPPELVVPDYGDDPRERGYLVFTTHDGDENDATFYPETEENTEWFDRLCASGDNDKALEIYNELDDLYGTPSQPVSWHSQTLCTELWPFNDKIVLKTYYLLVY
jgi:hypothetical protein